MSNKLTTFTHLTSVSNAVKKYVSGLVGQLAETTADAIEELESKITDFTIKDKSTEKDYTLVVDNGVVYLDDGEGD